MAARFAGSRASVLLPWLSASATLSINGQSLQYCLRCWPDEGNRLQLLRGALEVAQHHKARVVKGDVRTDLRALVAEMPKNATRVIFHSAVLGYQSSADERLGFVQTVKDLHVVWVSNEPPSFYPTCRKAQQPLPDRAISALYEWATDSLD